MLTWLVSAVWTLDEYLKTELLSLQGHTVTVGTVAALLLVLVTTALVSGALKRALERAARKRGTQDDVAITHAKRLTTYVVWVVGAWIGLEAVGIRLDALLATGAVFAVGMGIALQADAESLVSGIILLVERTVRPGDTLLLDGVPVQVMHMRLRSTIVRNLDGQDVVLPNRELVQRPIVHLTFDSRRHRLRVPVRLALGEDVDMVRRVLTDAVRQLHWGNEDLRPEVQMTGLEPSGVRWEVRVWSEEPLLHEARLSELITVVVRSLQAAGLVLAPDRFSLGRGAAPPE